MSPDAVPAAEAVGLDLSADYFQLFDQPRQFRIDEPSLAARYRALQGATHPDRFAAGSAAEKRWSVQASSLVNDAYRTLRAPLTRAVYLLSLAGIATDEETDTRMDPAFLMEQMERREALEEVGSSPDPDKALDDICTDLNRSMKRVADEFAGASAAADWQSGRDVVRRWQFLAKLAREADEAAAALEP